jgi:hypothetical protein
MSQSVDRGAIAPFLCCHGEEFGTAATVNDPSGDVGTRALVLSVADVSDGR